MWTLRCVCTLRMALACARLPGCCVPTPHLLRARAWAHRGADPDACTAGGHTPLMTAAVAGHARVIHRLFKAAPRAADFHFLDDHSRNALDWARLAGRGEAESAVRKCLDELEQRERGAGAAENTRMRWRRLFVKNRQLLAMVQVAMRTLDRELVRTRGWVRATRRTDAHAHAAMPTRTAAGCVAGVGGLPRPSARHSAARLGAGSSCVGGQAV